MANQAPSLLLAAIAFALGSHAAGPLGNQSNYIAETASVKLRIAGYDHITCGSTFKINHASTNMRLRSQEVSYGTGSGQQVRTVLEIAARLQQSLYHLSCACSL
jgi:hypothetical protein